ncbi:hypothetical protein BDN70DRAFT_997483 [Pholiota conissans]|uniref:F-box domain-containing protein n=1 Tax=Pholiota conissans TaxID=109636 RepID=A0A9P5YRH1_9AGAR|nr:hypothetical protein BDN70DRAFT_997483 [Pholiota conissans]
MAIAPPNISNTPTEVLEKVLDFLQNDRASLYSASFVNRNWIYAPRRHLFGQIIIIEIYRRGRLLKDVDNARPFLELTCSQHSTILPAIQGVVLAVTTTKLIEEVIEVLSLSKALTRLTYINIIPSNLIFWTSHYLSDIRDLAFDLTSSAVTDDACLTFYRIISRPTYTLGADCEEVLKWLQTLDGIHLALETFDLRIHRSCHSSWGLSDSLNAFLGQISHTLQDLSWGIDYDVDLAEKSLDEGPPVDLNALVNLRSVTFRTHDLNAVCDALQSIKLSSSLEAMTIHAIPWGFDKFIKDKQCHCILHARLTKLASILDGKQFTGIKHLELRLPGKLGMVFAAAELEMITALEQWMKWNERGIQIIVHV